MSVYLLVECHECDIERKVLVREYGRIDLEEFREVGWEFTYGGDFCPECSKRRQFK